MHKKNSSFYPVVCIISYIVWKTISKVYLLMLLEKEVCDQMNMGNAES